jgi:methylaspartate mutase sigma subunit
MAEKLGTVVLGTIGSDAHVVGIYILRQALVEAGFEVAYLGSVVSQEEFIGAAIETKADAIWVSSLYGMALLDVEGFRGKCTEAGLKDIILYIGGLLTSTDEDWEWTEKQFKDLGFNRVYPPETLPAIPIADLKKDLGIEP